jgi:hypothetical protein
MWGWSGTKSAITAASYGLLYQPWMNDGDDCGAVSWMSEWQGKLKYLEITCVNAALSTTDLTCIDVGLNLGHYGGKPITDCLSYGTALQFMASITIHFHC